MNKETLTLLSNYIKADIDSFYIKEIDYDFFENSIVINSDSELNLSSMKQIWVTLKNLCYEKTYEKKELIINDEEKKIEIKLTQEDTLYFNGKEVSTQIRFLDSIGKAYASNIEKIELNNILKEGVIHE